MIAVWFALALVADEAPVLNLYDLPIGKAEYARLGPGLNDLKKGQMCLPKDVAMAARDYDYIVFGEEHPNKSHKAALAAVVKAMLADGQNVMVGMEMFTRPNQPNMAPWSMGYWDEATFQTKTNWATEWGFAYDAYKPMFDVVREFKLPLYALNVPRDWVRQVGRGGIEKLPVESKGQLPLYTNPPESHRLVFNTLMGGHPPTGERGEWIYQAQNVWDIGMADTAVKAMAAQPRGRKMVILAGSGHALYHTGIPQRILEQAGKKSLTIVGGNPPMSMTRKSVGDFFFVGEPTAAE